MDTKGAQDRMFEVPQIVLPKTPAEETFDALTEEFGPVRTENERGRRNRAVRQLLGAGATPEEIKIAAEFCRRNFSNATEMALCSWLSRSIEEHKNAGQSRDTFLRLLKPGSKT